MTVWMKEKCPVCGRSIAISPFRGTLVAHTDKAGQACPMSGRECA
jgi:hypothetical protein